MPKLDKRGGPLKTFFQRKKRVPKQKRPVKQVPRQLNIQKARQQARPKIGPYKGVLRDPTKLYLRGVILGYKRGIHNQHPKRTLVRVEDVKTREGARYYLGHRVLYIYRAAKKRDPRTGKRELRVISGKVSGVHGNNGTMRVNFKPTVPTRAFGKRVRVMLWPHRAPN